MIKLPPLPDGWNPQWPLLPHQLRARDIEVAKVVLEAVALVCDHWSKQNHVYVNGALRCGEDIRALEFKHE